MAMTNIPIALTPGEPAGIGPDLIVQLSQREFSAEIVVIADPDLLLDRAKRLKISLELDLYHPQNKIKKGRLTVLPIKLRQNSTPGKLAVENADYVIETLDRAIEGCQQGEFAALVTGPVHKGILNQGGISFTGHTEYLAQSCKVDRVVMLLQSKKLKVALTTTHLALRAVPDVITQSLLTDTLKILEKNLRELYRIEHPRIAVCGLNPHAGEGGYLGGEEQEIIIPVLDKLRSRGMDLIGPVAADTAFLPQNLLDVDAVLTMYHDQGLPVLKREGFEEAVNITLGLPFVRTSVDHGTALELAGTGRASAASLVAAIETAISLVPPPACRGRLEGGECLLQI